MPPQEHKHNEKIISLTEKEGKLLLNVAFDPAIPGLVRLRSCDTWHWSPFYTCLHIVRFLCFAPVGIYVPRLFVFKTTLGAEIVLHCELQVYMSFFYSFKSYRLRFTIAAISFASLSLGFRIFAVRFDLKKIKMIYYYSDTIEKGLKETY
jgi:hypothetical protein